MHDALALLATALDLTPHRARALAAHLPDAGGLVGLWFAGEDSVRRVLPPRARRRLGAWLALTERALEAAPAPERLEAAVDVARYFRRRLALQAVESFWVVMLDVRGGVLGIHKIAQGTLTACVVHPREVFAPAIRMRAAHVILVHNHPSGDPEPSLEDHAITEGLTDAGRLLDIPVIDHVIVARAGFRSIGVAQATVGRAGLERGGFSPSEPVCQYRYRRSRCGTPPSSRSPRSSRRARAKAE